MRFFIFITISIGAFQTEILTKKYDSFIIELMNGENTNGRW